MPPKNNSIPVAPTVTANTDPTPVPVTAAPVEKPKAAAITLENTTALAYVALKSALQQLIAAKVAATSELRLDAENIFEALRVASEQRKFDLAQLEQAAKALAGPVAFLNNTSLAQNAPVQELTANAGILAKRIVLLTPKA